MRTVLLFLGVALGPIVGIFGLFVLYSEIMQVVDKGHVPFSLLVVEVEMGNVSEIAVHGRVYTFKTRDSAGRSQTHWARGPDVTREELLAWRSSDASRPAPHIEGP